MADKRSTTKKTTTKAKATTKTASKRGAVDVAAKLERAGKALSAGEEAAALAALLELWRQRPAAAIADLVEQVSARVEKGRPPLSGATAGKLHDAWLALARDGDDADLARLLATLTETRNSKLALLRVEALAGRPGDPRLTGPLCRLLEAPPYLGYDTTTKAFWDGLHALLIANGDPRVAPLLRSLAARYGDVLATAREQMARWMARRAIETADAIDALHPEGAPTLLPDEAERARAFLQRGRGGARRSDEELLADVYAHPEDDAARMVYGDFLLEQNDPRGEFIALQFQRKAGTITPEGERRELELLKVHATAWLGELAPLAEKQGLFFERGFVARIELKAGNDYLIEKLTGNPVWATVRELGVSLRDGDLPIDLLRHPAMRSLRGLDELRREDIDVVCQRQLPIEYIGYRGYLLQREKYGVVAPAEVEYLSNLPLPSLRGLGVGGTSLWSGSFAWLWESPVGRRLEQLRVETNLDEVADYVADIEKRQTALSTLIVRQNGDFKCWSLHVHRDDAGRFTRFEASRGPNGMFGAETPEKLIELVEKLPPDGLTSFTLHHTAWTPSAKQLRPLAVALERFGIKLAL